MSLYNNKLTMQVTFPDQPDGKQKSNANDLGFISSNINIPSGIV